MSEDKPPYSCGRKIEESSKIESENCQNQLTTCENSNENISKIKFSLKSIIKSQEDIKEQNSVDEEVINSKLDQLDGLKISLCKKKRISFAEPNYIEENKSICRKKHFDKITQTDNKIIYNPEETAAEERNSVEENFIILKKECCGEPVICKVASISEAEDKLINEVKHHQNLEENTFLKAGDTESLGKKGKNYYTGSESFLKGLKNLFKMNKSKKSKLFSCYKETEKIPDSKCKIRVEAWELHDSETCSESGNEYKYIGELLFPVCSKDIFYTLPGVILRRSQKSYTINDPEKFGAPVTECRRYAFPDKVIPQSLLEWSTDEPEVNEMSTNLPEFPKSGTCICEN